MIKFVISVCLMVSLLVATLQVDFTHQSTQTKESEQTKTTLKLTLKTIFQAKATPYEEG